MRGLDESTNLSLFLLLRFGAKGSVFLFHLTTMVAVVRRLRVVFFFVREFSPRIELRRPENVMFTHVFIRRIRVVTDRHRLGFAKARQQVKVRHKGLEKLTLFARGWELVIRRIDGIKLPSSRLIRQDFHRRHDSLIALFNALGFDRVDLRHPALIRMQRDRQPAMLFKNFLLRRQVSLRRQPQRAVVITKLLIPSSLRLFHLKLRRIKIHKVIHRLLVQRRHRRLLRQLDFAHRAQPTLHPRQLVKRVSGELFHASTADVDRRASRDDDGVRAALDRVRLPRDAHLRKPTRHVLVHRLAFLRLHGRHHALERLHVFVRHRVVARARRSRRRRPVARRIKRAPSPSAVIRRRRAAVSSHLRAVRANSVPSRMRSSLR